MRNFKAAFLVPAHNEEKVIAKTLESLLKLTSKENIFVVNDGSEDNTRKIAEGYTKNVLNLYPNLGKGEAMNTAIKHFKLVKKYEFLMPIDADTKVDSNFLKEVSKIFQNDKKQEIACVAGRVKGMKFNYLTAYRIWEYEVGQSVHKNAQSSLNAITVCPGPATIYRSRIFKQVEIPAGTLTEDMDLTFLIHRKNLGKIKFCSTASVYTQDPKNIKDFVKQIDRWYTGLWQCVKKHNLPWGSQMLDAEVAFLGVEGLYNGILTAIFLGVLPIILIKNPSLLALPLLIDLLFFVIPTLSYTAAKNNYWSIFKYIPQFYLIRFISSLVFLKSFIKVVLGIDLGMNWFKASRYRAEIEMYENQAIFGKLLLTIKNLRS